VGSLTFTAQPQTVSLDLAGTGVTATTVKTLMTDDPSLQSATGFNSVVLPPFASWVASVQ